MTSKLNSNESGRFSRTFDQYMLIKQCMDGAAKEEMFSRR